MTHEWAGTMTASDAERMDRHYRFQRFIYDGTPTNHQIGRRGLIERLAPAPGQSVLEIGCGTAWNLVRCARRYPQARLFGIDVSTAMLKTARASLDRHDLSDRVRLSQGDARRISIRNAPCRNAAVRSRVFILRSVDDPCLEGSARSRRLPHRPRRHAAHRRLRPVRRPSCRFQERAIRRSAALHAQSPPRPRITNRDGRLGKRD